jgi:Family of unknown function (DUF6161)
MKLPAPITITDFTQKSWTFDSLEAFEEFIKAQGEFWSQSLGTANQSPTANQYIQRANNFYTIVNTILGWKPALEAWDSNAFTSNFTNLINSNIGASWLWSGHPFIEKWLELNQISVSTADAFFEAMVQKTTTRFANGMDFFHGYLIAYEYVNQDKTDINKRRSSEIKSLSKLRDQLTTKNNELIGNVSEFESEMAKWKIKTKTDFSDWFGKQVTFLDEAVLSHSKNFHEQLSNWTQEKTNLENKYQEKLRLEPSAQYWTTSASKLNTQGRNWARALVLSILLGFITFAIFFICWLKGDKTALSLQSLEGAILFATILSCYAFLLKSISKAMFSSFHLQRVSEESALLTNLYLSLNEGKDDDPDSRKIVLQALFSRSETGLLSGEHGPTMPSATEFINIIGKAR